MPARTHLSSLLHGNCPRCREGRIFKHKMYNLTQFNVMNETCPHCGVRLEPEPGFYQGAMYVSYAITVAFLVAASMVFYLFFSHWSEWTYIFIFIGLMLLLVPFNYRASRILYLYMFGGLKN